MTPEPTPPKIPEIRRLSIEQPQQDALRKAHLNMTTEEIENEMLVIDIGEKKIAVFRGE